MAFQWLVPKFHLGSHRDECADTFSFNYTFGVGRMHGEMVETIWAALNWLQYSTREMGAGHRRDVITEAMNYWNWGKVIRAGTSFNSRLLSKHSFTRAALLISTCLSTARQIAKEFAEAILQTELAQERLD